MPPKIKVTADDILRAAISLIRENGSQAINARTIASKLGCSTQPIFSNFETMKALHDAVVIKAHQEFESYMQREISSGQYPPYKAYGLAYIRFAKDESQLFQFLYMRDRSDDLQEPEDQVHQQMENIVMENTNLDNRNAQLFHLEMWSFVHGIASMFATGFLELDWDLVSKTMTDVYLGLRKQHNVG